MHSVSGVYALGKQQKAQTVTPSPFTFFPTQGTLNASCTQTIQCQFQPTYPQRRYFLTLDLVVDNLGIYPLTVCGVGASSKVLLNPSSLDFGVIRVGTFRELTIKIENSGVLGVNYFVESQDLRFSVEPEQGLIEGDGESVVNIRCVLPLF